jgi:hypothetical protein
MRASRLARLAPHIRSVSPTSRSHLTQRVLPHTFTGPPKRLVFRIAHETPCHDCTLPRICRAKHVSRRTTFHYAYTALHMYYVAYALPCTDTAVIHIAPRMYRTAHWPGPRHERRHQHRKRHEHQQRPRHGPRPRHGHRLGDGYRHRHQRRRRHGHRCRDRCRHGHVHPRRHGHRRRRWHRHGHRHRHIHVSPGTGTGASKGVHTPTDHVWLFTMCLSAPRVYGAAHMPRSSDTTPGTLGNTLTSCRVRLAPHTPRAADLTCHIHLVLHPHRASHASCRTDVVPRIHRRTRTSRRAHIALRLAIYVRTLH